MRIRSRVLGAAGVIAASAAFGAAGASAAFPNFSDCPLAPGAVGTCVDIQSPSGSLDIKGTTIPMAAARMEIRGGIEFLPDGSEVFRAPRGTNGFFAQPVDVPGGVLGIDLPWGFTKVAATAQLAGQPSDIKINLNDLSLQVPVKLKLSNPLFASGCTIGTNSNPVRLNLIVGTTNPPAPNRPISGTVGTPDYQPDYTALLGSSNVDNSFAIPRASNCNWIGLGVIDGLINLKMKLPSAAGNNTMIVNNNIAFKAP
jgi:hypothetical protein